VLVSGFTGATILAQLLGADGAGSGLDADLLDGQQAAAFAPVAHTHNYVPLSGAALTGPLSMTGEGVFAHFANPGITSGRIFIEAAAGVDPTSLPGDIWLGY
jgi:hypothetical protein